MPYTIAVVGVGNVGWGWAIAFARADCAVHTFDASAAAMQNARAKIAVSLSDLSNAELVADVQDVMGRMVYSESL